MCPERRIRSGSGLAFAETEVEAFHLPFEHDQWIHPTTPQIRLFRIHAAHPGLGEEFPVFYQVFDREVAPVQILEVIVDFRDPIGPLLHRLVVTGVVNIELIARE